MTGYNTYGNQYPEVGYCILRGDTNLWILISQLDTEKIFHRHNIYRGSCINQPYPFEIASKMYTIWGSQSSRSWWLAVTTFSDWKPCISADHKQFLSDHWLAAISSPDLFSFGYCYLVLVQAALSGNTNMSCIPVSQAVQGTIPQTTNTVIVCIFN